MTKQELLQDLINRDWVHAIGEPQLRETKPDGGLWYTVNISETYQKAAVYRNIDFYVFDEGGVAERAYYKDNEPTMYVSPSAFRHELNQLLINEPGIFGWTYRVIRETFRIALIETLVEDSTNPEMLVPALFLVSILPDSTLWKKQVNLPPEVVAQTANAR